ncbi:uncharacterized protein RJT20DRAFT_15471 [Scheffersomyces xylosifermentans]|uniref:uncharacterized protein n=1 Tax=Scheffersomyces xylosifermentans TaxID=1304137 RepID=UPI00315D54B4
MVSLHSILMSQPQFSHMSTGIPSLDILLSSKQKASKRVYDFQSTPGCYASYVVLVSLIFSHISQNRNNKVIIIETLASFPWHLIRDHKDYKTEWGEHNIVCHKASTFALLYALFVLDILDTPVNGTTMVIINDFHDLLELYKYELSTVYEEKLLKHHLETNATIISNQEQFSIEGTKSPLPELPAQSDLLKTTPISKYNSQIHTLMTSISKFCFNHNSTCFLVGHLNTKYAPYKQIQSQSSESDSFYASMSFQDRGRIVLTPSLSGGLGITSTSTYSTGSATETKTNDLDSGLLDSHLAMRLVFYKDWYHKSPHFQENFPPLEGQTKVIINKSQLRLVFAVRVAKSSPHLTYPPIYFDFDNFLYHLDDDSAEDTGDSPSVIDLSSSQRLSGLVQSSRFPSTDAATMSEHSDTFMEERASGMYSGYSEDEEFPSSPNAEIRWDDGAEPLIEPSDIDEIVKKAQRASTTPPDSPRISGEGGHDDEDGKDRVPSGQVSPQNSSDSVIEESEDEMLGSLLPAIANST